MTWHMEKGGGSASATNGVGAEDSRSARRSEAEVRARPGFMESHMIATHIEIILIITGAVTARGCGQNALRAGFQRGRSVPISTAHLIAIRKNANSYTIKLSV